MVMVKVMPRMQLSPLPYMHLQQSTQQHQSEDRADSKYDEHEVNEMKEDRRRKKQAQVRQG